MKTGLINTLKNAFMYDIKEKLQQLKGQKKDPFFDMFLSEWTLQIQQKKVELMQVASNTD